MLSFLSGHLLGTLAWRASASPPVPPSPSGTPLWTCRGWAAVPGSGRVFLAVGRWSGLAASLEQIAAERFRAWS